MRRWMISNLPPSLISRPGGRSSSAIAARVASGQTGSRWMLEGYNRLHALVPQDEALQGLTRAYVQRQRTTRPVHTWEPADTPAREKRRAAYEKVSQVMHKDLKTVQEEDAVKLAEAVMRWEGLQHVPVENESGDFVGLVSPHVLLVAWKDGRMKSDVHVGEIMDCDVPTVGEKTPTLEAIRLMREQNITCLPVVREGKLVGMLNAVDFLVVASRLLQ